MKHKGELPHLSTGSFMDNVKFAISLDCLAFFERYEATEVSEAAAYRECETLVGFRKSGFHISADNDRWRGDHAFNAVFGQKDGRSASYLIGDFS